MRCPRCRLADLSETTQICALCGYAHATTSPTELDARRELARDFRIERLLESASAPLTYLAQDAQDRALIVKVVPLAQLSIPADRVLAALESAARLDHPHILPIHDSGTTEHFLWYATKHAEARSLGSSLGTVGAIELGVCLRMFEQIASALEYAHRRGMTHGALSPECVLVHPNEWVLVSDFGTAGLLGPPEVDQRALAQMARHCLTGIATGDGQATPRNGHPALPPHVSQALRRAMSVQATDQFPSTLDFVTALGEGEGGGGGEATGEGVAAKLTAPARLDATAAWFSSPPRRRGGRDGPLVISDSDADPAASRWRGRIAAAAGIALTLSAGAAWLGLSSVPSVPLTNPGAGANAAHANAGAVPQPTATNPRPEVAPSPRAPAPARATAPAPAPPLRPPTRLSAPSWSPPPAPVKSHAEPALLSVNAIPWGSVYVDGRPIGNTPQLDVALPPGTHRLRVEREGFRPYERTIDAAPGQRLRITDIALAER
jgi:PEGA domain/Protein kinase domain